jgi:putative acetyltransferase
MEYRAYGAGDAEAVERLFVDVFSASEGEEEGRRIGDLVRQLMATTPARDLEGFVAAHRGGIVGAIFFSRLTVEQDMEVFLLSPVAVGTDWQGQGIGQALITHGLGVLREQGVQVVTTYGDPAFYAKVGFEPVSEDVIAPPVALSQPEGWLGQSLTGEMPRSIPGRCRCVEALNDPVYW